jgi:hypothetical protein
MQGAQETRHWVCLNGRVRQRTTLSVKPQSLIWDRHYSGISVHPGNQSKAHASCIVSIAGQLFL